MPCASWSCYCRQEIPPSSDRSLSLQHSWKALDGFPSSNHCASSELCCPPSHPRLSMFFSQQGGSRRELFLPSCRKDARSRFPKERGGVIEADRFPLSKFKASMAALEETQYVCVRGGGGSSNGSVRFELCQLNATSFHVKHSLSTLNIHRLMRYWNIEASTPITYICGHPVVDVTEIGSREILKRRNILGR